MSNWIALDQAITRVGLDGMRRLKQRFYSARLEISIVVLLLVSVGCILFGALGGRHSDVMFAIGSGALGGGVFAFLTKYAQIGGVFRDELEDVIYGRKHLADRVDKEDLWINATKSLYGDRFPDLIDRFDRETLRTVWPSDERFYQAKAERTLILSVVDKQKGIVKLENTLTSELVTDVGGGVVTRRSSYEFNRRGMSDKELKKFLDDGCCTYTLIGGSETVRDHYGKPEDLGDGWISVEYQAKLKAGSRYHLEDSSEHDLLLEFDNVSRFVALSYVDGLTVAVSFPEDELNIQFYSVGPVEFADCEHKYNMNIRKQTKDLLFSDVGFLITVQLR